MNLVSIDHDQNHKTTPVLGDYIFDFEFTKGLTVAKTTKPQQNYRSILSILNLLSIDHEQNRKTAPVLGKYIVDFEFIREVTMIKTANRSRFTEVYSQF